MTRFWISRLGSRLCRLVLLPGLAVLFVALGAGEAGAPSSGEPQVHRPGTGEYQHLWLTFDGGEPSAKAFVGLRNGKSTTVWFLGGPVPGGAKVSGASRVLIDAHGLAVAGNAIKGRIVLRQVSVKGTTLLADVTVTIDAKKTDDGFAGVWSSEIRGGKTANGSVSGILTDEATIQASQAFAPGIDWPSYHGPNGTNRAVDSSALLIDDLTKAKPVWRAEESVLSGWGTGVSSRYTWLAAFGTVCGGSSSPVVADGRVYLFHYIPAGEPDAKELAKVLADFEKVVGRKPLAIERASLVDYCRPVADTVVTCLDARTGAVLWRVVFPRWMGNVQAHKWRGLNPSASVIGSTVIVNDLSHNWVALDAITGDVRWTIKKGQKVTSGSAANGAVRAGSLAILTTNSADPARAVDPKTGKVAWEQLGGPQAFVWGKPGAERVVFIGKGAPTCHDAATGKLLWTMNEKLVGNSGSAALIDGDILVGHLLDANVKKRGGYFQGWKLKDAGPEKLWQDSYLPYDENLTVTLGNGRAYLVGENEIRCLDIPSGKLLGKQIFDGKTMGIGSNQWLGLIGDRLLLAPEGQHGSLSLQLLHADPSLKLISKHWSPPNNSTTAYAVHSLAFPVVDGRIFVRGMNGIYCYDLRKTK